MDGNDKKTETSLRLEQEKFCQNYVSKEFFASGVESYADAYGIDVSEPGKYNTCKTNACRLLTNAYVLARINELLDLSGLNTEYVDKQLLFVITQNADMGSKVAAIREYNKLKSRITDRLEVKGDFNITLNLE